MIAILLWKHLYFSPLTLSFELFLPKSDLRDAGQGQSAQSSENTLPISGLFFLE